MRQVWRESSEGGGSGAKAEFPLGLTVGGVGGEAGMHSIFLHHPGMRSLLSTSFCHLFSPHRMFKRVSSLLCLDA